VQSLVVELVKHVGGLLSCPIPK
jgi:hypothetical protein